VRLVRRLTALLLAALALAGCGGGARSSGHATLWITHDRGASLVLEARVPAGETLLRALRSKADVDTRYGGRFVQSIDGVAGSLSRRHDWFWFVNGYAGATSAAEYRLHDGDVAWWDYRDWSGGAEEIEVVAGAFPEPFLHGFDGRVRPTAVRFAVGAESGAHRVADRIGATDVAPLGKPVPAGANLVELGSSTARPAVQARLRTPGTGPGAPARLDVTGGVDALLRGTFARRFGS
jgi:Domain of unknown function (DUF4430)